MFNAISWNYVCIFLFSLSFWQKKKKKLWLSSKGFTTRDQRSEDRWCSSFSPSEIWAFLFIFVVVIFVIFWNISFCGFCVISWFLVVFLLWFGNENHGVYPWVFYFVFLLLRNDVIWTMYIFFFGCEWCGTVFDFEVDCLLCFFTWKYYNSNKFEPGNYCIF